MKPRSLTARSYATAIRSLSTLDPDLGNVVGRFGHPPRWEREPGFATLMLLILEQQVSLASAKATFDRLEAACREITPKRFMRLDDDELRAIGFSRQKSAYGRALSEAVLQKSLDVEALPHLPDDDVRAQLTRIKGIGDWTADIYLLMVLQRHDIWPAKDLALAVAAHEIKSLARRPTADELMEIGEAWRPWRAVAARILWHYYLNTKRLKQPTAEKTG